MYNVLFIELISAVIDSLNNGNLIAALSLDLSEQFLMSVKKSQFAVSSRN